VKTLYLVRHAKSSWKHPELTDRERPLNKRGKKDAPFMGKLLKKRGEIPQLMVSSPAVRAHEIAKAFAEEFGFKIKKIRLNDKLYLPAVNDFYGLLEEIPDNIKSLMLFSHNFGITDFANEISDIQIDNIPTSGVTRIDFESDSWNKIKGKRGKLIFFEYPSKYCNA